MVREFLSVFNRKKPHLKKLKYQDKRALFLTGYSAHPFFSTEILPFLKDELGLNVSLHPVKNRFWGESVTVSGLLTGQDLLREARAKLQDFDHLVLPPNCLNQDDLFLDNLSLDQFQTVLQKPVSIGQYDLAATIKDLFL
jgi:NifB/MoaA-like Fe-S oxidoreductase